MPADRRRRSGSPRHSPAPHAPAGDNASRPASGDSRLLTWLLYPALLLVALAWCTIRPLSDPDTWFHMALGREVLQHGALPRTDIFSHTSAGNEWISSGWLSSVLLQWLFQTFGESGAGLVGMVFVVVAAAYLVVYASTVRFHGRAAGGVIVLPLLAGVMAAAQRFQPRPDVWTQLFIALTAVLLLGAERRLDLSPDWPRTGGVPRRLWLLPVLFALWANLHAGYLAGLLLVALFAVHLLLKRQRSPERSFRGFLVFLPLLLCGLTWMLNPYGPRLAALAGKIAAIPQVSLIYEWMPLIYYPRFAAALPVYCGAALLLLFAGLSLWKSAEHRNVRLWHLAAMILFLALALLQRRQISLAAIVMPAFLIPYLPSLVQRLPAPRGLIAASSILLTGAIVLFQQFGSYKNEGGFPKVGRTEDLPVFATDFLNTQRPPGRIYNAYNIGGYLLYHLGPQTKVFIDGRLDVYDHQVWLDSLAFEDASLPLDVFTQRYGTDTVVVQISDAYGDPQHLATRLSASPDWQLVHFDDRIGIFVRATPATAAYLSAHGFRHVTPFQPERLTRALATASTRQTALNEIRRALTQSGAGGSALALAALASAAGQDQESARHFIADALTRAPASPPVQAIAAQLLKASSGNR